ncbi:MAG: amidohydrolase family protein [Cloacibacterium sp.]|nr:amidohydrolase family protein [Cloacibacterium sp.]
MKQIFIIIALGITGFLKAQIGHWPNDTSGKDQSIYAITNITLYQDYKTKIENAALVFSKGKIIASGRVNIPKNAVVTDGKGAFVYPSFIDPYTNLGLEKVVSPLATNKNIYEPKNISPVAYNDAVRADIRAVQWFTNQSKDYEEYLKQGFGAALSFNQDGIVRGSGVLIALGEGSAQDKVLKEDAGFVLSLDKGTSKQMYPSSLAGSIALVRQTYLDADWYDKGGKSDYKNPMLEAFNQYKKLPTLFETNDKWDILKLDKIGDEAGVQYIFLASGNEYQRAKEIKATQASLILPLEYPKPYAITDPLDAEELDLTSLKHWELAPYNAVFLAKENIPFAFTLHKLKDKSSFFKKIRELYKNGLSKEQILQSLTEKPAQLLQNNQLGNLMTGSIANFIMTSEDIFNKDAVIFENWVQGKPFVVNKIPEYDLRGAYRLTMNNQTYDLKIKGNVAKPEASISQEKKDGKAKLNISDFKIGLELKLPNDSIGNYRIFYPIKDFKNKSGWAVDKSGNQVPYTISYIKPLEEEKKKEEEPNTEIGKIWYPFAAFGAEELPKANDYLIKGATVWTNTNKGIAKQWDVKISNGKIVQVGENLPQGNAILVDAQNKHLTNGIIDEHTHIGLSRGVNEVGANATAEVRMADALNPDDINFYRQLAGGVTLAQQLHGSANPIGAQSSLVKFKWGDNQEGMSFPNAPKFIKFALGENVKQSNWGGNPNRFPQSRSGVEQAFDFWFTRAKEYEKEKKYNKNYRKDLRLESVLEIADNQRFITCHSYVQSEINMFMKVAEKFGFKVNTFTHILEGYKLADKMKNHGANASTFSDWWAYKEEVREAIPYNAALLMQAGVNTAINSDDAEMARRLNQEAGKLVKYGGVSQEEAWKTVTLNPAKMLRIDHKVGSVEVGKDADLVLWTDNPLSIYAKAEKTWVDGILYYDLLEQGNKEKILAEEKNRLIQKMLFSDDAKKGNTQPTKKKQEILYHCDTLEDHQH